MKIHSLNVTDFGALKNINIALSDNLNVIYGENESGKSTLQLFIKFMLYGLPRKNASNPDRERSLSWDTHTAAGSMTLSHEGKEYRIDRRAALTASGSVSETKTVVCLTDGETVFKGIEPGEAILGVPKEVFESTCFVGQSKMTELNGSKTASAIENLMSTADDSIDVPSVIARLEKYRVLYKHKNANGKGSIPRLEAELAENKQKLRKATEDHLRLTELTERSKELTLSRVGIAEQLQKSDLVLENMTKINILRRFDEKREQRAELERLESRRADLLGENSLADFRPDNAHLISLRHALADHKNASVAKTTAETKLAQLISSPSYDKELASIGDTITEKGGREAVLQAAKRAENKARTAKTFFLVLLLLGIAALSTSFALSSIALYTLTAGLCLTLFSFLLLFSSSRHKKALLALCGELKTTPEELGKRVTLALEHLKLRNDSALAASIAAGRLEDTKKSLSDSLELLRGILSKTVSEKSEIDADSVIPTAEEELKRLERLVPALDQLDLNITVARQALEKTENELRDHNEAELRAAIGDAVSEYTDEAFNSAVTSKRYNASKLDAIDQKLRDYNTQITALRASASDPLAISDKLAHISQQLENDVDTHDALVLAIGTIEQASNAMRKNFTPAIGKKAGELMEVLTRGKYSSAITTPSLDLSVEADGFNTSSHLLSGGTKDLAYLALRLSIIFKLFPADVPPLVFDEALAQFDDDRAAKTLELLSMLGDNGVQTILFTCHKRDPQIASSISEANNVITMGNP